jgi:hypothetical protein
LAVFAAVLVRIRSTWRNAGKRCGAGQRRHGQHDRSVALISGITADALILGVM